MSPGLWTPPPLSKRRNSVFTSFEDSGKLTFTRILVNFYRCTIESILTSCISVWYGNCSAADRKALQRLVKTTQHITGAQLPTIQDIYHKRCLGRVRNIIKDVSHRSHGLFTLLPSGRRYRSLCTRTSSTHQIFFLVPPISIYHEDFPTDTAYWCDLTIWY